MALSGYASYPPTMQEFLAHWDQVNAALAPSPLVLPGGYGRAALQADYTALTTAITTAENEALVKDAAAATRDTQRVAAREKLLQFRNAVDYLLAGTSFARTLPTLPPERANPAATLKPFQEAIGLWTRINVSPVTADFTPPLTLQGGTTLAQFTTDVTALQDAFNAVTSTEQTAGLARDNRDALLTPIREHLVSYRKAVIATFPKNSPLVQRLPAISPTRGSTPDAVTLQGHWDAAQGKTLLTWTASDNPALERYSVRKCAGPRYKAADEQTIGDIAAGTTGFEIAGTPQPGSTDCFKVYVVLTTGNTKGSNAVKVTRS